MLHQGLNGIDATTMIPTIINVAYGIVLVGFLIGVYEAVLRGGDVQALLVAGIKYLIIAIILANWSSVFHEVNDSFNQIAQFIAGSSGAGDMFLSWFDQLKQQFSSNGMAAVLPSISASFAAIVTALMILLAYFIYALAVVVFSFFYVLYGCVLYVFGPLVLALLPASGIGRLAKGYATHLMIWNAWGVLYATFGSLITALQFNRIEQVMSQGFFGGFFQGGSDSLILALVSVLYALALLLIPFLAGRLISGDVGSTAISLARAGAAAMGTAISGFSGFAGGLGTPQLAGTSGMGGASVTPSNAAVAMSSSAPPQAGLGHSIREGIMSAFGALPPRLPSSDGNPSPTAASTAAERSPAFSAAARSPGWATQFRPMGLAQTIAFHAARFAGSAVTKKGSSAIG
ncbi:MAG: hypothetical protein JOZ10_00175 [Acidobacteria bacterium]|nr:hypothetical protein [Acidobacteriota bacterium]